MSLHNDHSDIGEMSVVEQLKHLIISSLKDTIGNSSSTRTAIFVVIDDLDEYSNEISLATVRLGAHRELPFRRVVLRFRWTANLLGLRADMWWSFFVQSQSQVRSFENC